VSLFEASLFDRLDTSTYSSIQSAGYGNTITSHHRDLTHSLARLLYDDHHIVSSACISKPRRDHFHLRSILSSPCIPSSAINILNTAFHHSVSSTLEAETDKSVYGRNLSSRQKKRRKRKELMTSVLFYNFKLFFKSNIFLFIDKIYK